MALGAAIGDGFRHGIWLVPYNVLPQIPAIGAEGEGNHPRDAYEVFGLEAVWCCALCRGEALSTKAAVVATIVAATLPSRIAIPQIQPKRPIIPQHSFHFTEKLNHSADVALAAQRRFEVSLEIRWYLV
jgi:hypothetical protein